MQSFIIPKAYISDYEPIKFSLIIHKDGTDDISKVKEDDVFIRKGNENTDPYYEFKSIHPEETELSLEVFKFKADCYRLILGSRQPKVKIIYNQNNRALGLLTEFYTGYFTFRELVNEKRKITIELLEHSGIARVWAAAFVELDEIFNNENVGNGDQYGLQFNNDQYPICVRIDSRKISPQFTHSQFPADEVMQTEGAMDDMHETFLFRMLTPDAVYDDLGKTISDERTRNIHVSKHKEITRVLREDQISNTDFQNYIYRNKENLRAKITEHFNKRNEDFSDHQKQLINLDDITNEFDNILEEIRSDWYFIFTAYHPVWEMFYNFFKTCMNFVFGGIYQSMQLQNQPGLSLFSFLCHPQKPESSEDDLENLERSGNTPSL